MTSKHGTGGNAPRLVAVCGLPGVGKSTVSSYVAEQLDGVRLRTDAIRKELVEKPEYTDAERERVYVELFERAEKHLAAGTSVVLDGTFAEHDRRETVRELADDYDVEFLLLQVVCTPEVVKQRIRSREDISDADVSVYRQFEEEFDALEVDHVRIDNSESLSRTREQVDAFL